MAKYKDLLWQLMPQGEAWSRIGSGLDALFGALAEGFQDSEDRAQQALLEMHPLTATETLPEWEAQYGLLAEGLTLDERRAAAQASRLSLGGVRLEDYRRWAVATLRANDGDVYGFEHAILAAATYGHPEQTFSFELMRYPGVPSGASELEGINRILAGRIHYHLTSARVIETDLMLPDDENSLPDRDFVGGWSPYEVTGAAWLCPGRARHDWFNGPIRGVRSLEFLIGGTAISAQVLTGGSDLLATTFRGAPAVGGGGGRNMLGDSSTVSTQAQPFTVYMAGKWPENTGNPVLFDGVSSRCVFWTNGGKVALYAGTQANSAIDAPAGANFVAEVVFNGASSSVRIEAEGHATISIAGMSPGSNAMAGLALLADGTGTTSFAQGGEIAELFRVPGVQTSQREALEYLRSKYRLPLMRVLCVGNSLTYGLGATAGHEWPTLLGAALLPNAGVVNLGHSAYRTSQLTELIDTEVVGNLSADADCVIVLQEGGNSLYYGATPAEALQEISDYIARVRHLGIGAPVFVCTCGPRGNVAIGLIKELNQLLGLSWQDIGAAGLIDLANEPALDPPGYVDGIHYDDAQYATISGLVRAKLESSLR